MRKIKLRVFIVLLSTALSCCLTLGAEPETDAEKYWPQWRGPLSNGVSPGGNPPLQWSESKNVAWKIEIPGKGSSSPVIWGDHVFVTTAIPTGNKVTRTVSQSTAEPARGRQGFRMPGIEPTEALQFVIYAIARRDGKIVWERAAREEVPHEGTHPTGTWASNSPVTDGEHVYAYFGSRGLYCYDMDGTLLWDVDFGDMEKRLTFGEGESPALYGDKIVIAWDHEGQSFIVALDKRTGKELWRTNRDEMTSWATPLVVEFDGKHQVITSATGKVRSYDLDTGKLIWETPGMTLNTIPTPVHRNGVVYITSGFRGSALLAIQLEKARGDISGSDAILWTLDRDTPYAPSPLLYEDTLYFTKSNNGILLSFDARNGKPILGPERLSAVPNIYASPVGAAGRVYIAGREGTTVVIEHGSEFKVLATNVLDDGFDASPAVVDKEIYLRGKNLYRISEP